MEEMMEEADDFISDALNSASYGKCGQCGTVGAKWTCGRCHTIPYCNKECQRKDWRIKHRHQCHLIFTDVHGKEKEFSNLCMLTDKIFSNNSTYPILETDPNMKVIITDLVSFGDLGDAERLTTEKIPVDGTIIGTEQTVRHFHPGVYRCTRAIPFENWQPVFIYHHEDIDPCKIIRQSFLMMRDFSNFHKDIINSINRYDWTHWSHWGDEEDEEFLIKRQNDMYFTRTENASYLKECVKNECIVYSNTIPSLYSVTSSKLNSPIAMAVEIENKGRDMYEELSWIHGKAFQDISSQNYFALMIYTSYIRENEMMTEINGLKCLVKDLNTKLSRRYPDMQFTSIKETELKFNMNDFRI